MAENPLNTLKPDASGPEMWRGMEEYLDTPEFREMLHREFPDNATEWTDPVSRRKFLTLMGASIALAGAVGCSPRPMTRGTILPYVKQPESVTPGLPNFYASAVPLNGVGTGVLIKSYEGRPVKIEGNPDHPGSKGGCDSLTQASLLGLYDPDRSQGVKAFGSTKNYDSLVTELRNFIDTKVVGKGEKIRFLTETITSPTVVGLMDEMLKLLPDAKWVQWDATGENNVRAGTKKAFGEYKNVIYDFTKADVVLTLDSDVLSSGPGSTRYARDFASRRKVRSFKEDGGTAEQMNRLYAVEYFPTPTGSKADHRLALKPSLIEQFARTLAVKLEVAGSPVAGTLPENAMKWINPLAADLLKHKGKCVVVTGENQPAAVHALVLAINSVLGNIGTTVLVTPTLESRPSDQFADLKALVADMDGGKVETLFVFSVNPVYTTPADLKFAAAMDKVKNRIHLGMYEDETSIKCQWHIPESHYTEAWGDIRGYDGTVTIQQPLIAPLYATKSILELLAGMLNKGESDGYSLVQSNWAVSFTKDNANGDFGLAWKTWLKTGVVEKSAFKIDAPKLGAKWADGAASAGESKGMEISFRADPTIFDGRFSNNGWLQEVPKPITKVTWDNAAYISPHKAKELGLTIFPRWTAGERGRAQVDLVEITYQGRKLSVPIWILPGMPDDAVVVHLGFGRERAGRVGTGIGFNANLLKTTEVPHVDFGGGVEVKKTDGEYIIACTQMHHNMEGRKPVRHGTLARLKHEPMFARVGPAAPGESNAIYENIPGPHQHKHETGEEKTPTPHHDSRLHPLTVYNDQNPKKGRRWGMVFDLNACNGCSACLIACVSENNGPVVGKDQVSAGREMHWIRIDRYYEGDPMDADSVETHFQPVACVQCEKAPCEIVCPVAATAHSSDGLNDMVYNRCVGTRYCSNNCPYKVRRFNFLTYSDWATESLKLMRNPEVTVRSRGVMEKCTYCVQRLRAAEIEAERERRDIVDGEIVTACQAACPSAAIMFGDIMDEKSELNRWKSEPTNYGLLAELNTMPRTTYLAALRNPNPDMPGVKAAPKGGH